MRKQIILLLLAAFISTLTGTAIFAMDAAAPPAVSPTTLPQVMTGQWETEIFSGDRPVYILLIRANCQHCQDVEAMLVEQIKKHPELKFVKVDVDEANVHAGLIADLPYLIARLPGVEFTVKEIRDFHPSSAEIDAVMNEEAAFASRGWTAAQELKALEKEATAQYSEYSKKLDALNAEQAEANRPFDKEVADIEVRKKDAASYYDGEIARLQAEKAEALQPFREEEDDVWARRKLAWKPLNARRLDLNSSYQGTALTLAQKLTEAKNKLNQAIGR